MENEYLLRIDFKKETENPERVFSAMSELIQALREIDRSLSASISTEIETKLILEDVEAGSIIAKGGEGVCLLPRIFSGRTSPFLRPLKPL